jgi:hypothetical protein
LKYGLNRHGIYYFYALREIVKPLPMGFEADNTERRQTSMLAIAPPTSATTGKVWFRGNNTANDWIALGSPADGFKDRGRS